MKKKIKSKIINKTLNETAGLTKSLGELMKDEDGFVSKETILKVGLSTVAALGVAGALTEIASGQSAIYNHTNTIVPSTQYGDNPPNPLPPGTLNSCITHTNVTAYTSY